MTKSKLVFPVLTEKGFPKAVVANAIHALREDRQWASVLAFDSFSIRTVALHATPWENQGNHPFTPRAWSDIDDIHTAEWLQKKDVHVGPDVARQAVEVVAKRQEFHPVTDYLDSIVWDGRRRLASLASAYFGAEESAYTRDVSQAFMISAVARVKQPGCKVDTMPVFEGHQGAGKSSAMDALFSPWFSDEMADPGSKDAAMQLQGAWCIEIAELDAFGKAETTRIKAFLSRRKDRFRPPYGSRVSEFPRQCVFAGTTNKDDYLRDETGGRRFWPIRCGRINLEALQRDRDQLWAEARSSFQSGSAWWLDRTSSRAAAQEQAERFADDPWRSSVVGWANERSDVSIPEILEQVLDVRKGDWKQPDQNRVARILIAERHGCGAPIWERRRLTVNGSREWRYVRQPDPLEEERRVTQAVSKLRVVTGTDGK